MRLLLTMLTLLMWSLSFSQVPSKVGVTHFDESKIQRYQKDYELKDFTLTASNEAVLYQLDLDAVEHHRDPFADVEVTDIPTGLTIILYSEERARSKNELIEK